MFFARRHARYGRASVERSTFLRHAAAAAVVPGHARAGLPGCRALGRNGGHRRFFHRGPPLAPTSRAWRVDWFRIREFVNLRLNVLGKYCVEVQYFKLLYMLT